MKPPPPVIPILRRVRAVPRPSVLALVQAVALAIVAGELRLRGEG